VTARPPSFDRSRLSVPVKLPYTKDPVTLGLFDQLSEVIFSSSDPNQWVGKMISVRRQRSSAPLVSNKGRL
jgi:hypothetical protein